MKPPPVNLIALAVLYGVGLVVSIVGTPWEPVTGWAAGNLVVFFAVAWVLLFVHHGTHAVAARALGLGVRSMRIGMGPRLVHAHVGRTEISLHLLPNDGQVALTAPSVDGLRLRLIGSLLAAPLVHVAIACALIAAFGADVVLTRMERPWQTTYAVVSMVLLADAVHLVNFVPFEIHGAGSRAITTDALRAMRVAAMTPVELLRLVAMHEYGECRALVAQERGDEAIALAHKLIAENRLPEMTLGIRWTHASALTLTHRYAEAYAVLRETLGPPRPAGVGTSAALANAAWAALMTGDDALRVEADRLSREAIDRAPDDPHVERTRGTVLLRMGRTDEAAELLRRAARGARARRARAYGAVALAVVAARRGQASEARARVEEARRRWNECDMIAWAETEIAAIPRA
jgi:hypothetical protein